MLYPVSVCPTYVFDVYLLNTLCIIIPSPPNRYEDNMPKLCFRQSAVPNTFILDIQSFELIELYKFMLENKVKLCVHRNAPRPNQSMFEAVRHTMRDAATNDKLETLRQAKRGRNARLGRRVASSTNRHAATHHLPKPYTRQCRPAAMRRIQSPSKILGKCISLTHNRMLCLLHSDKPHFPKVDQRTRCMLSVQTFWISVSKNLIKQNNIKFLHSTQKISEV